MNRERLNPFFSLLLFFLLAPVVAALASPWIFKFLQAVAPADSVLDAPFHRVTSRVVLMTVALFLYPAYKLSGFRSRAECGLTKGPGRWFLALAGLNMGIWSMLPVYILGGLLGVFVWRTGIPPVKHLTALAEIFAGGLLIGVFEEILFRGFIFNALRKSLGLIAGILLSSCLFSIVHFMRPTDPTVTDAWYSGFLLLSHLFDRAGGAFLQEALTLFGMGVVLAVLCHRLKSIYLLMGLHAGWVWIMMLFRHFTDNQQNLLWLYGRSDWVSQAWIGPIITIIFLIAVILTRDKWKSLTGKPMSSTI